MTDRPFRWLFLALVSLLLALAGCEGSANVRELGSETHFLRSCATTGCDDGFTCLCGVCTQGCFANASCSGLAEGASCVPSAARVADGSCEDQGVTAFCDLTCENDADCAGLAEPAHCDAGFCRSGPSEPAPTCPRTDTSGARVVVFGDALIELSPFTSHLEDLARAEGSLAQGANFRAYATALNSFLAGESQSLAVQYDLAREDGPFSVAVMNGGETDMLQLSCGDTPESSCSAVQNAITGLNQLFSRMTADGVSEVIYFFYADPVNRPMVKAGLDVLRPLAESACEAAPLPCHFIDLRPVFQDHYDDYVGDDGLVFSEAGARASADTVWTRMENECVSW
jgi:hypothetical protein